MNGFPSRMYVYLSEMFPLPRHLFLSAMVYLSVACFGTRLDHDFVSLSVHTVIGIASVFGLLLMLRLMDELKDHDLDARLFPNRPLCTGVVRAVDVQIGLALVTIGVIVANAFMGEGFISACILVGFAYLMFRHFFVRDVLRASLPLTLMTHQPIVPLLLLYCLTVVADEQQHSWDAWDWRFVAPYLLLLWMPFLGWEISRKIRGPQDETEYVTYSRLWGPKLAMCSAIFVQTIPLLLAAYLDGALRPTRWYLWMMAAAYIAYLSAALRFLQNTKRHAPPLKRFAELYLVGVLTAQVVAFGILPGR